MKPIKLLLSTVLFLGIGYLLNAQTNLNVLQNGGTNTPYALSNIKKLTFGSGNMNVVKTDNTSTPFALTGIQNVNFGTEITPPPPATCLNTNGDFASGATNWSNIWKAGNVTSGTNAVVNGEMAITNIAGATADWHVQLEHYYNFQSGVTYTLRFDARANVAGDLIVATRNAGSGVVIQNYKVQAIGTEMTTYNIEYAHFGDSYTAGQMLFYLGNFTNVYLDNVCVIGAPTLNNQIVEQKNNFLLYPNPVKSVFNINAPEAGNIEVISLDGKVLLSSKVKANEKTTINIENLSTGIYICRYTNNKEVKTIKLVKQ